PFRQFIEEELRYENLRTALRLKKYDTGPEEIREQMTGQKTFDLIDEVINAENLEEAINAVNQSDETEGVQEDQLENLEHALETQRLRKALRMLHIEPLGITSILGYIVAKIIEVKNLRMLIRAKETKIQNLETIRKNLVMA
ncbi:MAG: hypothetical protein BRC26_02105, partial [Nanohaloarchaea archaeon QH_8_44_6]